MKNVFLFPGQGSQAVGMGRALAEAAPAAARLFEEADRILGWSLREIAWNGPEEELKRTDRTQPALYVTSMASVAVLAERGIAPGLCAGHSVGEYAALATAGVFDFETGLRLVALRGEAMHEASVKAPGGMAALLGIEVDVAEAVCAEVRQAGKGMIAVANLNAPGQIVISGEADALAAASALAKERGAVKVMPLAVAGAWHCDLMKSAEARLAPAIRAATFLPPVVPVVANVTARPVSSVDEIRELLVRQVCGTVRWSDSIRAIEADGGGRYIEAGAGGVLAGLMKRIAKGTSAVKAGTPDEIAAIAAN
jgi:[acyl-carrier-protein] S-malonyltransferase